MYVIETPMVLRAAGYTSQVDFHVEIADGVVSLEWNHGDPQPSPEQVIAWRDDVDDLPTGGNYTTWKTNNVGDGNTAVRYRIKQHLQDAVANKDKNAVLIAAILHAIRKNKLVAGLTPGQVLSVISDEVDDLIS